MIPENYTKENRASAFNKALSLAITQGSPCVIGAGLSPSVMQQINKIARAYPKATASDIAKVKEIFVAQQES